MANSIDEAIETAAVGRNSASPETFYSLIANTILEQGPMCVSEIYKALADTTLRIGKNGPIQANWKNSVRHALSYKKYFIKSKGNAKHGRGCLWGVDREKFLHELSSKKARKRLKTMSEVYEATRKRNQKFQEFARSSEKILRAYYCLESDSEEGEWF